MKRIWEWLGTTFAAKIVSLVFCVFFVVATLGKTGSYWDAFNALLAFYSVWGLGRMTAKRPA
jgi:hypothetical protein